MDKQEAKQRIERLRELINHHRYLYHVLDKPEISDNALDSLKKELFDLEAQFPEFVTLDSPTQRVGGAPQTKFEKARHFFPMLSLNDAFSKKDMEDWLGRISKLLSPNEIEEIDFFCELKIDGLAIELVYENGILKTGSTRGDGLIGENVTQNLKTIEAIPLKIGSGWAKPGLAQGPREVVVRGEAFCGRSELDRINREQKEKGLPEFANPRNLAAGSIRQLDPKITANRRLDSFAYDLITNLGQATHQDKHKILNGLGFKINPNNKYCKNLSEIFEFHKKWQKERERLPYEIDGIVVIVNNINLFEKLGVVGKAPRGAVAFKFPLKQATTLIEDIKVQVGRTGAITPIAVLKPVELAGVTISRATLHNEDEIKKLDIKIGDTVIVGRAGDVIPDIIKALPELRTGNEKDFYFPAVCPACQNLLTKKSGEAVWRCENQKCFARKRENFYHFVSRGAFDIVGLGPKIIDKLLDEGLILDSADLFFIKEGDIMPLERFAEKSAKNLISAIQSKKKIILSRFIYALGIRNVGEETSRGLAEHFNSIDKLARASTEDLQKVADVGPIAAKSIHDWFRNKNNLVLLDKLVEGGVEIENEKQKTKNKKLLGATFVLTGSLKTMSREEAKEKILARGGKVSGAPSAKTDYVVAGLEPGLKFEKAKKIGAKIINEDEFVKMIK